MTAPTMTRKPILDLEDVAVLLGVDRATISQYMSDSRPGKRYSAHPFPEPNDRIGKQPWWLTGRKREILQWAKQRPGQGAGGGRPRKGDAA